VRVIRSGLTTADQVIVDGIPTVRPGMKVTPKLVTFDFPADAAAPQSSK
jgi:hypothetical protein